MNVDSNKGIVHTDRPTDDQWPTGAQPGRNLVASLGATYNHDPVDEVAERLQPDVVIEATGVKNWSLV